MPAANSAKGIIREGMQSLHCGRLLRKEPLCVNSISGCIALEKQETGKREVRWRREGANAGCSLTWLCDRTQLAAQAPSMNPEKPRGATAVLNSWLGGKKVQKFISCLLSTSCLPRVTPCPVGLCLPRLQSVTYPFPWSSREREPPGPSPATARAQGSLPSNWLLLWGQQWLCDHETREQGKCSEGQAR